VERLDDRLLPSTLAADFGGNGLWAWFSGSGSWLQLTTADAAEVDVADNGDVVASFAAGPVGLWRWVAGVGWQHLSAEVPQQVEASAAGEVFADLGAGGLWRWRPAAGWQHLTALDPSQFVVTAGGDAFGDFGASGVWRWAIAAGWQQLTTLDPQQLALGRVAGELFADLGAAGVWGWTVGMGWLLLTAADAESLTASDYGALAGDFGPLGLWRWTPGTGWLHLSALDPVQMVAAPGGDLYVTFTSLAGPWRVGINPPFPAWVWSQLAALPPDGLEASSAFLFGDFSTAGLWRWTFLGGWVQLSPWNAESLSARG
jgi:hypothetical protein